MKRLFALFAALFTLVASAQDVDGEYVDEGDGTGETNVIAYFCKRDTMEYNYTSEHYFAMGTDTIVKSFYSQDFRLVVSDSTDTGYRLTYTITAFEREDTIRVDAAALMREKVFQRLKGRPVVFETDEMGSLLQVENWSAIRNDLIQGVYAAYNELYPLLPGLETLVPKGKLMGIVSQRFQSEEGVRSWFEDVNALFDAHGRSFEAEREINNEGTDEEPASKTYVVAGLLEEDDAEFEDDYYVTAETTTQLRGDAIETYLKQLTRALGDDSELGKALVDLSKQEGVSQLDLTSTSASIYFYNGWPRAVDNTMETATEKKTEVKRKYVEWTTRSWYNY